jgi:hypothetical protein
MYSCSAFAKLGTTFNEYGSGDIQTYQHQTTMYIRMHHALAHCTYVSMVQYFTCVYVTYTFMLYRNFTFAIHQEPLPQLQDTNVNRLLH